MENTSMNDNLKKQLIKLGSTNPDLRPHIRAIFKSAAWVPTLHYYIDGSWSDWMRGWDEVEYSDRELRSMAHEYAKELEKVFRREYGRDADIKIDVNLNVSGKRNYLDVPSPERAEALANKTLEQLARRKGWW
jgi:hypothetical protein